MLAAAGKQARPTAWPGFAQDGKPNWRSHIVRGSGTLLTLVAAVLLNLIAAASLPAASLDTARLRFALTPATGRYEILDKQAGVTWRSNPYQARFGEAVLRLDGQARHVALSQGELREYPHRLELTYHPLAGRPKAKLQITVRVLGDQRTLEFAYQADPGLSLESIRLLDDALWVTDDANGYVAVPVRLGLLLPANSGRNFTHRFDTFAYEGCHMEMLGAVQSGAAVLVTWHDPYVAADIKSQVTSAPWLHGRQAISTSLTLRKSARSFRLQFLGRGNYVTIAKAYRQAAQAKGWYVPWHEKLAGNPERKKLFGAINFKLWSALTRRMNDASTQELSVQTNWTFREAAQIAEHLKGDLQLDKVLFLMGGWIHRGYDNQHPDILPTAPECGGDAAFAECARRVMALGYLFGLHDNYQDMYRDAPSWDESYLNRNPDGSVTRGGRWAGGRAYITCSRKALELARRPQNLPAVQKLCHANAYFIDTTYAAGLRECFSPVHPLTRTADMHWKQALSDYARGVFGIFGSECGREWAIPHSDFFEGLTGVSGRYYHNQNLRREVGGVPVPLFELVYRECIAMYGKYGYDPARAAEYVLHHIAIGRPLNYHRIPPHLYWQATTPEAERLVAVHPSVTDFQQVAPGRFRLSYRWQVDRTPAQDWRVFVHFTDADGRIRFQNDHQPPVPTSRWPVGTRIEGPFTVTVPKGMTGRFDVRIGLFQTAPGPRAPIPGAVTGERSLKLGQLRIDDGRIAFEPAASPAAEPASDPGVFTHAEHGWAEGLHPLDRFVKNTYEILSPLNELTAQMPMTQYQFLTPDRQVTRTVFGTGPDQVKVVVNRSRTPQEHHIAGEGNVLLPPYGFVITAPTFLAFHAREWNGERYPAPVLFTVRSLDGRPLAQSKRLRVFHGFGDANLKLGDHTLRVEREQVIEQ